MRKKLLDVPSGPGLLVQFFDCRTAWKEQPREGPLASRVTGRWIRSPGGRASPAQASFVVHGGVGNRTGAARI